LLYIQQFANNCYIISSLPIIETLVLDVCMLKPVIYFTYKNIFAI